MEENELFQKKKPVSILDAKQAQIKAEAYCAYQERYQQEVRDKLYSWGLHKDEVESIISDLISNGFINEERYAKTFAGGKFRIKKWGKVKIRIELKKRNISEYCINKALQEINKDDNIETIKKIVREKYKTIKEKNPILLKHKTAKYAISRGFEADVVWEIVNDLIV